MNIYKCTLEEAKEEIDTFCYNWNIIKLCYELWENDITKAYNGKSITLHEIAGVGKNYINEICAGKVNRETCKRTFNATQQSGVLEYVRGVVKITEPPKLKEYIVLSIVYNDWLNKSRQVKHLQGSDDKKLKQAEDKLKQINEWLEKNYKHKQELSVYIKSLKTNIMKQIEGLPKMVDDTNYTPIGKIKNYLLGEYSEAKIQDKQYDYLIHIASLLIELDCDMISSFSDEDLEILEQSIGMLYRRVKAENDYRKVHKEEKSFTKKYTEGADKKYIEPKGITPEDEY